MNCEFHCFKPSGKWYTSARGILTKKVYDVFTAEERKAQIVKDNDGKWPGLSTEGEGFICIAINDENTNDDFGYPMMFPAKKDLHTNAQIMEELLKTDDKLNGMAGTLLTRILFTLSEIKKNRDGNRENLLCRVEKILDPQV